MAAFYVGAGLAVLAACVLPWLRVSGLKDEVKKLSDKLERESSELASVEAELDGWKRKCEAQNETISNLKKKVRKLAVAAGDPGDVWDTVVRED